MRPHDFAIIGGGPAGASAATLLAREGFDVALFDRARFPRDKACGEFVNPGACDLLDEHLGLERCDLVSLGAAPVSEVSFRAGGEAPLDVPLLDAEGLPRTGLSIRRTRLDARLLRCAEDAGAQVHEGYNVRGVLTEEGKVCGVFGVGPNREAFERRARIVVACDGAHSIAARQLGLVRTIRRLERIGVVAHFAEVAEESRAVVMYSAADAEGVAGFSKQPEKQAVLSCVLPKSASRLLAGRLREFVLRRVERLPGLGDLLAGAKLEGAVRTIACHGHRLRRVSMPGLLVVGDAARFVDPFTGEGIHHAVWGAVAAARVATEALGAGEVSDLSRYEVLRRDLDHRYLLCDLVQAIAHHGAAASWGARQLRRRPELARKLIGVLGDLVAPRDLLRLRLFAQGVFA